MRTPVAALNSPRRDLPTTRSDRERSADRPAPQGHGPAALRAAVAGALLTGIAGSVPQLGGAPLHTRAVIELDLGSGGGS